MRFTKMHGCGNDYVYIDGRESNAKWAELSPMISDRHMGIGSDGIIIALNSNVANVRMLMFNSDGSEGDMCGNGVRCFAKFVIDKKIVKEFQECVDVETKSGVLSVLPLWENNIIIGGKVKMGVPRTDPRDIPVILDQDKIIANQNPIIRYPVTIDEIPLQLTFVSMGNPHAVAFIDEPIDSFPLSRIGPKIENHPMFPDRVNFEIVNRMGNEDFKARVWERGSGETMACGSGACAIAVASRLVDISDSHLSSFPDSVKIQLPGGTLNVIWDGLHDIYLEGPVKEVFSGDWNLE